MKSPLTLLALSLTVGLGAAPASAGFFLEGLKPFTQEPKCPDPYAMNKTGCEAPDTAYPAPAEGKVSPESDARTTTREGAPQK